jgi:hypothetical protein
MADIKRQSPVRFKTSPLKSEVINNWTVALAYDGEGQGPWLTDLAHKTRWDLQDKQVGDQTPCDLAVPKTPGNCTFAHNTLVNRMNRTQVSIYHLGLEASAMPEVASYTDVSESTAFLALYGPNAFFIAEKLTNLDFMDPAKKAPFLLQGPFCHVPCQVVLLEKLADHSGGLLLTCSRGYTDSMVHAILEAGAEFSLRTAGENHFQAWIQGLQG